MENTLENKARFNALYFGQKVYWQENGEGGKSLPPIEVNPITLIESEHCKMLLKSISSITDEDALEVANILTIDKEDLVLDWKQEMIEILSSEFATTANSLHRFSHACDWLRSKGYALPYMGLSVEKLIEYGWIILIEN